MKENMFLKTNDKIINLKNVSNINILEKRIIFNMNYSIEIFKNKFISDYVYWDALNLDDLDENLKKLFLNDYFNKNFFKKLDGKGFINKNEISSIKFDKNKNRVIFNLSHPVTFKDSKSIEKLTSEFVYVNCNTIDKYNLYINNIKETFGELNGN
jgi:hypothetical protein